VSGFLSLVVSREKLPDLQKTLLELFFWIQNAGSNVIANPV